MIINAFRAEFHFVPMLQTGRWWFVLVEAYEDKPLPGAPRYALAHDDDCKIHLGPGSWKLARFPKSLEDLRRHRITACRTMRRKRRAPEAWRSAAFRAGCCRGPGRRPLHGLGMGRSES
jgi:hypothetical protein